MESKFKHVSNYIKCKWFKHTHLSVEIIRMDWEKKKKKPGPNDACYLQDTHTKYIDVDGLKGWKNTYHANTNQKKVEWLC